MHRSVLIGILVLTAFAFLSGCSLRDVRDVAVNSAMPAGSAHVMRDVARTAEDVEAEESAERSEQLSAEYEEFLRENGSDPDGEDEEERSVIMVDPDGQN